MQGVIMVLSILVLVLALILVPKKMHLHSLTIGIIPALLFIIFGLSMESIADWDKYIMQGCKYGALVGGVSFGACCTTISNYLILFRFVLQLHFLDCRKQWDCPPCPPYPVSPPLHFNAV